MKTLNKAVARYSSINLIVRIPDQPDHRCSADSWWPRYELGG